jgi:hypothetical protein
MRAQHDEKAPISSLFEVGNHALRLTCSEGRWTVTIDSVVFARWYLSQAAAWEAGVREADRLDRAVAS